MRVAVSRGLRTCSRRWASPEGARPLRFRAGSSSGPTVPLRPSMDFYEVAMSGQALRVPSAFYPCSELAVSPPAHHGIRESGALPPLRARSTAHDPCSPDPILGNSVGPWWTKGSEALLRGQLDELRSIGDSISPDGPEDSCGLAGQGHGRFVTPSPLGDRFNPAAQGRSTSHHGPCTFHKKGSDPGTSGLGDSSAMSALAGTGFPGNKSQVGTHSPSG